MVVSIAYHYVSEMDNWKTIIDVYLEEAQETEEFLNEVLQYNTIPKLAAKVEHRLNALHLIRQELLAQRAAVNQLEGDMYKDHMPIGNEMISWEMEHHLKKLRKKMHKLEKDYLEIKYDCSDFLARTISKQHKKAEDAYS